MLDRFGIDEDGGAKMNSENVNPNFNQGAQSEKADKKHVFNGVRLDVLDTKRSEFVRKFTLEKTSERSNISSFKHLPPKHTTVKVSPRTRVSPRASDSSHKGARAVMQLGVSASNFKVESFQNLILDDSVQVVHVGHKAV